MQTDKSKNCGSGGWLGSSVGRKQLIGLSGVGLSLFVLIHMLENMLLIVGPKAYNEYTHFLTSNSLIYLAEAGLLALFMMHIALAMRISWTNFKARDSRYAVLPNGPKRTTLTQRSLWAQGLLILAFLILHLNSFKFGPEYSVNYGQGEMRDMHKLVIEVFHQPGYLIWYVVALLVLGLHLRHGVGSSFQSLGFHHPRYQKKIQCLSIVYALIVACGFIVQPLYVFFIYQG